MAFECGARWQTEPLMGSVVERGFLDIYRVDSTTIYSISYIVYDIVWPH